MSFFNSLSYAWVWNNPYRDSDAKKKIYYSSFTEQPKTLDPARAYSSNEYLFIAQTYEPLLQYDYFLRPYQLVPLTAKGMPIIRYVTKQFLPTQANAPDLAYTIYTLHIKPGIYFQPHPALAKNKMGKYRYLQLPVDHLDDKGILRLSDFKHTGTRELIADDYIYQIKRLANPAVNSPIYGLMSEHILGFREFATSLPELSSVGNYINLREYALEGLKKIDQYTFEITLKGEYPQFLFWLSMPFFSPIPWEADKFYSQRGMSDKNLSFDWYPIGTGPFMLKENNPNKRMVLSKNPNFRQEFFPTNFTDEDRQSGYVHDTGKVLPLIDEAVFTLEKESIPRWNKFLQGYYDLSGIAADSYDQAIQLISSGAPALNQMMREKKMQLTQTTDPSIYYLGFNMRDPLVGGSSERARKLRMAISIAVNFDENIAIFYNGRGYPAQGIIPPGIYGFKGGASGINPYVYEWEQGKPRRRLLHEAKQLMLEAGYPGGKDPTTGRSLILHYDVTAVGGPDDKSQLDWMRKQFSLIGIDLDVRATQYNRFQEKMRTGNVQVFSWAWNADYPDPENFLFLLYGPNAKVAYGGENAANYTNPRYDSLFNQMKNLDNGSQRQQLIDEMVEIVRHDAPWVWGINTETFILTQPWLSLTKPNTISASQLKFMAINVDERERLREAWNKPILWPIGLILLVIALFVLPLILAYYAKEKSKASRLRS